MMMTSDGQSIRIRCNDIRQIGRNAQGVKLVSMKEGVKLQEIAKVVPEDENEEAKESEEKVGEEE
jgi:DNA gyrase subunit A